MWTQMQLQNDRLDPSSQGFDLQQSTMSLKHTSQIIDILYLTDLIKPESDT